MHLKDLYKLMVSGQRVIISKLINEELYTVHDATSDNIPLELLDMHVLLIRNDYFDLSALYIIVEE